MTTSDDKTEPLRKQLSQKIARYSSLRNKSNMNVNLSEEPEEEAEMMSAQEPAEETEANKTREIEPRVNLHKMVMDNLKGWIVKKLPIQPQAENYC